MFESFVDAGADISIHALRKESDWKFPTIV